MIKVFADVMTALVIGLGAKVASLRVSDTGRQHVVI